MDEKISVKTIMTKFFFSKKKFRSFIFSYLSLMKSSSHFQLLSLLQQQLVLCLNFFLTKSAALGILLSIFVNCVLKLVLETKPVILHILVSNLCDHFFKGAMKFSPNIIFFAHHKNMRKHNQHFKLLFVELNLHQIK